jgi:outer membrane receptor for ferrienterochelin and colicins
MKSIALFCRCIVVCCVLIVSLTTLRAQGGATGVLSGEVTASSSGAPMPGVTIRAQLQSDSTFVRYTFTNGQGKYRLTNLRTGTYSVRYGELGYKTIVSTAQILGAEPTVLRIEMSEEALHSEDVVVTASRHEEKVTSAPASVSVITNATLREHINASPTDALASVPGMDVSREGIAMSTYSSRSMHSVFGSDILTMNDYHSMEVPAIGGFYGILMPQVPDDIERVEVVRGPGSALYGPDAATGVVHFISRSPFASQGTSLSISGGERNYLEGSFRHAQMLSDRLAFKVSGRYLAAKDWQIAEDTSETKARTTAQQNLIAGSWTASQRDSLGRIGTRDTALSLFNLEGRVDAILSDNMSLNLTGGLTRIINDIALTEDFGGAQIKNWQYMFGQARFTWEDLFFQVDINHNDTKDSYFLPTGALISDQSTTYSAQLQHRYDGWKDEKLTYGVDYRMIKPKTNGTLYGKDDGHADVNIFGAYLQSQTTLLDDALEVVLAARLDKHSYTNQGTSLAPILSPRAAVVYHLTDEHLVRAMYNETYLFPTENALYADLLYKGDAFGYQQLIAAHVLPPTTVPVNIRYVGPYISGLHFNPNTDGSYTLHSTVVPGGTLSSYADLWKGLMQMAAAASGNQLLLQVPAPPAGYKFTYLSYLNLMNQSFGPPTSTPEDISEVKPQHQRTLELDYQGSMSKTFQFEVDAYQTHYTAIRASTAALTPNEFLDSAATQQYLTQVFVGAGLPQAQADGAAQQVAGGLYKLPLGVVQASNGAPDEQHPNDLLVGTRNYLENSVEFFGIDAQAEYKASDVWSFSFGGSWLSKNYWYAGELKSGPDSSLQTPFALNMPLYRASVGARYSGLSRGLSLELRDRWSDAFKMTDNYYAGDIHARHVLDLTVNYRPDAPQWNNLLLTLSVNNLLDNVHQEFAGAPYIGRLTVLRAAYILPPFWSPN